MSLSIKDFYAVSTRCLAMVKNPEYKNLKVREISIDMITGIAANCDWVIFEDDVIKISHREYPKNIFLNTVRRNLNTPHVFTYFIHNILPLLTSKFNLIIASEDMTFPYSLDTRYPKIPDIDHMLSILFANEFYNKLYVENLDTKHEKMIPIPLGMHYRYKTFDFDIIPYDITSRSINVFCRHRERPHTQFRERSVVSFQCKTHWKDHVFILDNEISYKEYFDYLKKSIFTLCVHGGGLDSCPKAFEAICCGSIPIIKRSALDEVWERFPVVLIDDWTDDLITKDNLDAWYNKYKQYYEDPEQRLNVIHMMTMKYWWNIIDSIE
jgi:hypothetical protein